MGKDQIKIHMGPKTTIVWEESAVYVTLDGKAARPEVAEVICAKLHRLYPSWASAWTRGDGRYHVFSPFPD